MDVGCGAYYTYVVHFLTDIIERSHTHTLSLSLSLSLSLRFRAVDIDGDGELDREEILEALKSRCVVRGVECAIGRWGRSNRLTI